MTMRLLVPKTAYILPVESKLTGPQGVPRLASRTAPEELKRPVGPTMVVRVADAQTLREASLVKLAYALRHTG